MDCSNRRTRHMKKKLTEDKIVDIVVYFLLAIIGIITVYPFYYTIICSLNDGMDLMKGGVYLFPRKFTLANYQLFLSDADWMNILVRQSRQSSVV